MNGLSATQKLSSHFNAFTSNTTTHAKKTSSSNGGGVPSGTQTLKQSLKDLQEMLKITQNKLQKTSGGSSSRPT